MRHGIFGMMALGSGILAAFGAERIAGVDPAMAVEVETDGQSLKKGAANEEEGLHSDRRAECRFFEFEAQKPYLLDRHRKGAEEVVRRFIDLFGEEPHHFSIFVNEYPDGPTAMNDTMSKAMEMARKGDVPFVYMDRIGPKGGNAGDARKAFDHELAHYLLNASGFSTKNDSWWEEAAATVIGGGGLVDFFDGVLVRHHLGKDRIPLKELLGMAHPVQGGMDDPDSGWAFYEELQNGQKGSVFAGVSEDLAFTNQPPEDLYRDADMPRRTGAFYAQSQSFLRFALDESGATVVREWARSARSGGDLRKILGRYAESRSGGMEGLEKDWLEWVSQHHADKGKEGWRKAVSGQTVLPPQAPRRTIQFSKEGFPNLPPGVEGVLPGEVPSMAESKVSGSIRPGEAPTGPADAFTREMETLIKKKEGVPAQLVETIARDIVTRMRKQGQTDEAIRAFLEKAQFSMGAQNR